MSTPSVDQRIAPMTPRFWDGRARPYIAPDELSIDPSLRLHTETTATVDPITLEVVRYSLLHLNFEHASLLCRLAISPAVMVTRDMQTSLLTEVGELAFMGPGLQYFATASSLIVKWTLENRAASPGINP